MRKSKNSTNISSPDRWSMARFLREETGATALQYAVLSVLILTAVLTAAAGLGMATAESLDSSCELLKSTFMPRPL